MAHLPRADVITPKRAATGRYQPGRSVRQPRGFSHRLLQVMAIGVGRTRAGGRRVSTRMRVLGIETTCDETAAAVVRLRPDGAGEILSDEIMSQIAAHAPFGGVVPEIA